jgi:hypothetical protein
MFMGGISNHCGKTNPQGIRFQHKFDPIPSIAMWKGQYAHQVQTAMLLWDMVDMACESDSGCAISSASLASGKDMREMGLGGANPFMIKDYLCDKWGAEPKSMYTDCYDLIAPYMSMLNPWPCGQILFQRVWAEEWEISELQKFGANGVIDVQWSTRNENCLGNIHVGAGTGCNTHSIEQIGAIDVAELQSGIFRKFEDYQLCVLGYEATLSTYIQNAIIDMPDLGAFVFTFSWVHSVYGYYPLCTSMDSSGDIIEMNIDSADTAGVNKMDGCSGAAVTTCANSCSTDYSNPWCMEDCMEAAGCYDVA